MNTHEIAAEAFAELGKKLGWITSAEGSALGIAIIEAAIEKAYGAGLLDGASEVLNESRAAHGTSAVVDASEK